MAKSEAVLGIWHSVSNIPTTRISQLFSGYDITSNNAVVYTYNAGMHVLTWVSVWISDWNYGLILVHLLICEFLGLAILPCLTMLSCCSGPLSVWSGSRKMHTECVPTDLAHITLVSALRSRDITDLHSPSQGQ